MTQTTIRQYLEENYEIDVIKDIANHGCAGGSCSGLIYYGDTTKFHDEYEEEIWDLLQEYTDDIGHESIPEFIASLGGAKDVGSMPQMKNLLVWFAVEAIARQINDNQE